MGEMMEFTDKQKALDAFHIRTGELASALNDAIEKAIRTRWVPERRVIIYPTEIKGWNDAPFDDRMRVFSSMSAIYSSLGWTISYNDTQRDGAWIEIK